METAKTLLIIRSLADGLDPETGKAFDLTHPYQHPNTIRALFAAAQALEQGEAKESTQAKENTQAKEQEQAKEPDEAALIFRPVVPPNAGKPWTEEEEQRLCSSLGKEVSLSQLAEAHGRTYGDIRAHLETLGQLGKLGQVPLPHPESTGSQIPPEADVPEGMYVFRKMALPCESAASAP